MSTDPVPAVVPPRPSAEIAGLRRLVWISAMFLAWGAFELGRWTEAAKPWQFSPAFSGSVGVLMMVAALFGLRTNLRALIGPPSVDGP
jgi:hypothetical protein